MGDSDALQVGDFVLAIGNPFGLGQTVTSGIVSAVGRTGLAKQGYEDFIQTDAPINPGNSGGALVNLRGQLIGINTAILSPAGGNIGIGFAVPINMARRVMEQLVQNGEVRRGRIGVVVQDLAAHAGQSGHPD
jgi:serine protease Do